MGQYILHRLLRAIPVLFGVSVLVFSMLHFLPGDPATLMLSETSATSKEAVDRLREQLGLNDPLYVQYSRFLRSALTLDMGESIQTHREVTSMILEVFPSTLTLTLSATALSVLLGVPLGIAAAVRPHSWIDKVSMAVAYLAVSMPIFWLGLMLILLFSVRLSLVPITSQEGAGPLLLPAFSLALGASSIIARLVRSTTLVTKQQPYVESARSIGMTDGEILLRYVFPNGLSPLIVQCTFVVAFAIISEASLSFLGAGVDPETPTWGNMLRDGQRVLQVAWWLALFPGIALVLTVLTLNLLGDALRDALDPRSRKS